MVTTAIHAAFMIVTLRLLRAHDNHQGWQTPWARIRVTGGSILVMFLASLIETSLWAAAYLMLGAISGAEPALYFSMVTFTTLGYGEIVLEPQWRLLASFEAANGIIMFGWTTAVVVAVVQRVYLKARADPGS